ncbi:sigma-54 dependent transcriptional regulator [Massilia sp. W12]|uniref:sigma-54 interaction domain-containing protein n=1 Tax=Massilia sp. W12 TaxID=3126507 RepID=UPI0030D3C706
MNDLLRCKLIGSSGKFRQVCHTIEKFAGVNATTLIIGETGTGKELAARAIHYQSARKNQAFIPVNCGALPEALVESELFGHERGAFTDAKAAAPGLVAEADGGTLFLDEIDALSLKAQAALLRFLQDKTYRRVGSGVERQADVRILAACNANLDELVQARQFRRDLLYRINVLTLRMPALREREGDALELAHCFLQRLSHQYRMPQKTLHPSAQQWIVQYNWPGNIRELENVIHREFLMCDSDVIQFSAAPGFAEEDASEQPLRYPASFKDAKALAIAEFERRFLRQMLQQTQGNLTRAAELSGQERSAFGKLARKHGLHMENFAQRQEIE